MKKYLLGAFAGLVGIVATYGTCELWEYAGRHDVEMKTANTYSTEDRRLHEKGRLYVERDNYSCIAKVRVVTPKKVAEDTFALTTKQGQTTDVHYLSSQDSPHHTKKGWEYQFSKDLTGSQKIVHLDIRPSQKDETYGIDVHVPEFCLK